MKMKKSLATTGFLLFLASIPRLAGADVTVRECILSPPPAGQAYLLPPSSGWKMIGSLQFNHQTASDYVVSVMLDFPESNTPDTLVEYQVMLDGTPHGWFTRRVPESFPTTQVLRAIIADVPSGIHNLGIRARNLGASNVYYHRFWISPLLVESSEVSAWSSTTTPVAVGSSWTTIGQTTVSVAANHYAYLTGFSTVTGGTAGAALEYRFVRGTTEIDALYDTVPDVMSDGMHMAFVDRFPSVGSNTYKLEARSPSGSSVTIGSRELGTQTIPNFTVFEATSGAGSIPNDDTFYALSATPWMQIAPASIGIHGTDASGFAHFTYTGSLITEAEVQLELEFLSNGSKWEVGWMGVNPSGVTKLEANMSDWEQLGLTDMDYYKMSFRARGLCQPASTNLAFQETRFQVLVIPDNTPYTFHSCTASPGTCCANNPTTCLAYSCTASGELALASGIPSRNCF